MAKIDALFQKVKQSGASDLHLVVGLPPLMRLNGFLQPLGDRQMTAEMNRAILLEMLSAQQREMLENRRDLDTAYELASVGRFRCNFFHQQRGLGGVFRLIPETIPTLEQLQLPARIQDIADYRKGLVLVTGPTGCGKSTTLAAIVDHINISRNAHILTIEDPLEFIHVNKKCLITQREVGVHVASFADALRIASREDPDVILVGEMRDLETMALALTCAELGILVLSTLHTNSAAAAVDRIINAFPADRQPQTRTMLAESLRAVLAQQLIRSQDGSGRCAALEILLGSPATASMIRESKISQIHSYIQTGTKKGMQTMDQHLLELVREGRVSMETAREKAIDKRVFKKFV